MDQLTKKEMNRIKSILNQSRIGLFDTEEKMSSYNDVICEKIARCTPDIKKVLDVFLCSSDTSPEFRNLFSNIDSHGVESIAKICSSTDNGSKALNNISIRTIFGGTEQMPFRSLLYLLPSLSMYEQLQESTPNIPMDLDIEFLFMNGAGIAANALDPERTYNATSQFINVAKKYIDEFHPSLSEKVNFYVDQTFTTNIIRTEEYQEMLEILESKLKIENNLKSDLLEMGERRNTSQNSIKYATLHAFSQDGHVLPDVAKMANFFGGPEQKENDMIISIGAKPEEKFFRARKLLAKEISEVSFFKPKETAQYIADITVPPYSPLKEGDLYMKDVIKDPDLIAKARLVDRKNGEYSDYHKPVQKAVELLIQDTRNSDSDKTLFEFMSNILEKKYIEK